MNSTAFAPLRGPLDAQAWLDALPAHLAQRNPPQPLLRLARLMVLATPIVQSLGQMPYSSLASQSSPVKQSPSLGARMRPAGFVLWTAFASEQSAVNRASISLPKRRLLTPRC